MNDLKEKTKSGVISYPNMEKDLNSSPIEYTVKKPKNTKQKVIIISASVMGVIIIALLTILCINLQSKNIFSNIYIDGVEVSHLSKEEAITKVQGEKAALSEYKLNLVCKDVTKEISGNDIDGKFDIEKAVNKAYSIGRYGNILSNSFNMLKSNFSKTDITSEYLYDDEKLNAVVSSVVSELPKLEQSSYTINDKDKELIVKKGKEGLQINEESVKQEIILALHSGVQNELQVNAETVTPDEIDIDKIHKEIYKEPKDATYNKEPFEIIPHQVGINFSISLDDAKAILAEDKEEYIIPLTFTTPRVTTDKIGSKAFPDLLSSFETTYIQSKVNRTTNLRVASNSINGVVIMPGETFSYNKTLGPRTEAAGYKMAGMYVGGEEVDGLGGGICQISSTLYNIVIMANLEIVERHNHQFLPGYVGAGRDATVVYGALDFKFKNNRSYPVKIQSSVGNGYVRMKLFGIKEDNEYEVSFSTSILSTIYPKTTYEDTRSLNEGQTKVKSYGQNGCTSVTYKILKKNGKEVSRVKLSNDTYSAKKKIVLRGTKKVETPNANVNTGNNNSGNTNAGDNNSAVNKPDNTPNNNKPDTKPDNPTNPDVNSGADDKPAAAEGTVDNTDKDITIEV